MLLSTTLKLLAAKGFILASLSCPASNIKPTLDLNINSVPTIMQDDTIQNQSIESAGGVAYSRSGETLDIKYRMIPLPGTDLTCIQFSKAVYSLKITPKMHINSKLKPGECQYNAVKRHYDMQVTQFFLGARDYQASFQIQLLGSVKDLEPKEPLKPTDLAALKSKMQDRMQEAIKPAMTNMIEYISQRNARTSIPLEQELRKAGCIR